MGRMVELWILNIDLVMFEARKYHIEKVLTKSLVDIIIVLFYYYTAHTTFLIHGSIVQKK